MALARHSAPINNNGVAPTVFNNADAPLSFLEIEITP